MKLYLFTECGECWGETYDEDYAEWWAYTHNGYYCADEQ